MKAAVWRACAFAGAGAGLVLGLWQAVQRVGNELAWEGEGSPVQLAIEEVPANPPLTAGASTSCSSCGRRARPPPKPHSPRAPHLGPSSTLFCSAKTGEASCC